VVAVEWIATGVLALAVFCGAYALGSRLLPEGRGLRRIRRYLPPVEVTLEYRGESGTKSSRRVAVVRSLRHRDGRLYLLGLCGSRRDPRTFRVDRIISVATADGEIVDTRRFLVEWLSIPPKLCPAKA
jgi:hypothetical protein